MLAKELISTNIPTLQTSDTGDDALSLMEVYRVSHLPIVNNKELLGLIADKDIYDMKDFEAPIGAHKLSLVSPYVYYNKHIYEVVELVSRLKLTVVPVLSEENEYLGSITLNDLLQNFAELAAVKGPGGIIVLEMAPINYSLSEISQIIEGNDAKILSLYITPIPEFNSIMVTLKLNQEDVTSVIKSLERYNYHVKGYYMEDNHLDNQLQDRYESLMRYLDT